MTLTLANANRVITVSMCAILAPPTEPVYGSGYRGPDPPTAPPPEPASTVPGAISTLGRQQSHLQCRTFQPAAGLHERLP